MNKTSHIFSYQALRQTSFKYKAKGNTAYATKAGEIPINRAKNRFKDILPCKNYVIVTASTELIHCVKVVTYKERYK